MKQEKSSPCLAPLDQLGSPAPPVSKDPKVTGVSPGAPEDRVLLERKAPLVSLASASLDLQGPKALMAYLEK